MDSVSADVLARQLARANAARKAAETLLEGKSLELYQANQALRALNANLEESETRSRKVLELVPEAIMVHTNGRVVFLNQAALSLFGVATADELLNSEVLDRVPPEHQALLQDLQRMAEDQASTPVVLQLLRQGGQRVHVEMLGTAILYNNAASMLLVARDITERLQHEVALEHQAMHDLLTGLPNRTLLRDRLTQAINRAERYGAQLGVMFLDLDQFKHVNDSLGHSAGDELLIETSERLKDCVRDCDTVARLGGDEFVLLIDRVDDAAMLAKLAQRVVAVVCAPIKLLGQPHGVTCSIGISTYPQDGRTAEDLLKQADLAMYRAKEAGRNNFQFFTHQMQERLDAHLSLERQLQQALKEEQFVLHFQPQVSMRSGRIIGLEALIRWQSPELGLVPPGRFIPLAEESNLILEIGEWVLRSACAQIKAWQRDGLPLVPVAVNVAAKQFTQQRVDQLTQQVLQDHRLGAELLELELTESMSMGDPESTIVWMHRLKEIGVSLAIDDFGTGYSSLSYLKRFPVDRLKIDRAFIQGLATDPRDHAITTTVIRLAHSLGLRTVAEGVETEGQLRLLSDESCDEIQGYYFCPPLPAPGIAEMLAQQRCLDLACVRRQPYHRTVLLIDDQPAVLASFERLMRGEDVELITTESTEQACEILARREVGVVVSDQRLPGEDGISFFARIKQLYPRTVRVLLTGHDTPATLTRAINRGEIYRFIAKPWDDAHVREVLREAARRYET